MSGTIHVKFSPNITMDIAVSSPHGICRAIELYSTLFARSKCGMCGSDDTRPGYRNPSGNDYFEVRCNKCNATLQLHQNQNEQKTLYIDNKDYPETNGWFVYDWVRKISTNDPAYRDGKWPAADARVEQPQQTTQNNSGGSSPSDDTPF